MVHTCKCGALFESKAWNAKSCPSCREKARATSVVYDRVCAKCKDEFSTARLKQIYCCTRCRGAARRERAGQKTRKTCKTCGNVYVDNLMWDTCSYACRKAE